MTMISLPEAVVCEQGLDTENLWLSTLSSTGEGPDLVCLRFFERFWTVSLRVWLEVRVELSKG